MASHYILGISALYHDSAAALLKGGEIIAAAQEERFSRVKHDARFPRAAIAYCLDEAGIGLDECAAIVFYDKPLLKFERLLETYLAHAPRGFRSFATAMPIWLKEKLYFKQLLRRECYALLRQRYPELEQAALKERCPPLAFSEHHLSHAASAFYPSPYANAAVLCLDGVGEWATSSAWLGQDAALTPLWQIDFPHSLGLLYSAFTYYCGFKVNSGEYKLMGLAPYGQPRFVETIYQHLIDVRDDGSFALNMRYFAYPIGQRMISPAFEDLFGQPALPFDGEMTDFYCDMAASIQVVIEEVVLKIARYLRASTQCEYLCLAGGVALNCVANGRLLREAGFTDIWIQPAAGDAGGALGAALEYAHVQGWVDTSQQQACSNATLRDSKQDSMQGAYLGPSFDDASCISACQDWGVSYTVLEDDALLAQTVTYLTSEQVVGWFQGRMEFGPRALGHRSILGDARSKTMQQVMNLKIKQRESFRPFAPIVLQEHAHEWFSGITQSPYMLLVAPVSENQRITTEDTDQSSSINACGASNMNQRVQQIRSTIPAVTHIDYSARVQTVSVEQGRLYALLSAFYTQTQVPVLINTSFNVRGEPPVCSPHDAIRCFLATEMDALVLGNVVLHKEHMPQSAIDKAKEVTFAAD